MSPGKAYALVLLVLVLLLGAWSLVAGLGDVFMEPPLPHLRFAAITRAVLLQFFSSLSALLVVCGLITFSLFLSSLDMESADAKSSMGSPGGAGGTAKRFIALVKPVMIIVIVLGIINGVWFGVFAPRAELRVQQIGQQTRTAADAMKEAERLILQESWTGAEEQLLLYQALVGETEYVADMLRIARAGILEDDQIRRTGWLTASGTDADDDPQWLREAREMTVAELVSRARQYLNQGDFFSAHHFASLAVSQSRTPRQDARSIQAEAFNAIERGSLARDEAEAREIYRAKVAAYEAFRLGETIPEKALEAYYRFRDLEDRIPEDPDVRRFAPQAQRQVRLISFFLEEARSNQAVRGRSNLVFVNHRGRDHVELVVIDDLVRVPSGDYLYGIEIMRTGGSGEHGEAVRLHARAPFGKIIGDRLVMRAITREGDFRDTDSHVVGPHFLRGSSRDLDGGLVLHHTAEEIARFGGGPDALATLSLPELAQLSPLMERLGRSPAAVHSVLMSRIFRIGGFFVLALLAPALGWRLRSRYVGRPPVVVLVLLPVIIWVVWWIIAVLRFLLTSVSSVLTSMVPLVPAVIIATVAVIMAIILSLFSLARVKL